MMTSQLNVRIIILFLILVASSIYHTYQSHNIMVGKGSISTFSHSTTTTTTPSYDMSTTVEDDMSAFDDDDPTQKSSAIRGYSTRNKSDHSNIRNFTRTKSDRSRLADLLPSRSNRVRSNDSTNIETPFHNETHISCFRKIGEGEWAHKIVTLDKFWSVKQCKFRIGRDTIYFHQGKAGGGTVGYMGNKYHLGLRIDHPFIKEGSVQDLMSGPLTTLIFTVRDPVDRFVSIFNWRLLTLCHPRDNRLKTITHEDSSTQQMLKRKSLKDIRVGGHAENPEKYCLSTRVEQEKNLRVRYRSDPNVMAEALCRDSQNYEQAMQDLTNINHSPTIFEWLELLINPNMFSNITKFGVQNFIAIPLSSRFEADVERVFTEMIQQRFGTNILSAMNDESSNKLLKKKKKLLHSSVKHGKEMPRKLSALAQCCLTQYYKRDYHVIQTMLGEKKTPILEPIQGAHPILAEACSWGDKEQQKLCKNDLRSMLRGRSHFIFEQEERSCSQLVT